MTGEKWSSESCLKKIFEEHVSDSWSDFLVENSQLLEEISEKIHADVELFEGAAEVFPPPDKVFKAFEIPYNKLRVVIIGQDPYHQKGQAMGLCFSVPKGIPVPPSLKNIYKELKDDIPGFTVPLHGDLTSWFDQGVMLLNTSLTVLESNPLRHSKHWKMFTDNAIKNISASTDGIVFLLWGQHAISKKKLIDRSKHHILECNHPSPLSANRGGWFGNKHFSKTNNILGKNKINWVHI